MRFYQYTVQDRSGNTAQGTIQAASPDAAREQLIRHGLEVQAITEVMAKRPAAQPAPVPKAASTPKVSPNAASRPTQTERPIARRSEASSAATNPRTLESASNVSYPIVHTRRGQDSVNHFIFSQLSNYLRSGVNAAQALSNIAAQSRRADYRQALATVSERAARGEALSTAFASYPDLFAADIPATLRVGEEAGVLPEAAENIAAQCLDSHRMKRGTTYLIVVSSLTLFLPFIVRQTILAGQQSIKRQWDGETQISGARITGQELIRNFSQSGPYLLAAILVYFLLYRLWVSRHLLLPRHRVAHAFPGLAGRSHTEGLKRLVWGLERLAAAGRSPQTMVELAVATIPNASMRRLISNRARGMREGDRLSGIMRNVPGMPLHYQQMVETGEMTGDVPGMLNQIGQVATSEYAKKNTGLTLRLSLGVIPVLGIIVAVILFQLYVMYYNGLFRILQP